MLVAHPWYVHECQELHVSTFSRFLPLLLTFGEKRCALELPRVADLEKREQRRKEWWNSIHELNRWIVVMPYQYLITLTTALRWFVFSVWMVGNLLSSVRAFSSSRRCGVA